MAAEAIAIVAVGATLFVGMIAIAALVHAGERTAAEDRRAAAEDRRAIMEAIRQLSDRIARLEGAFPFLAAAAAAPRREEAQPHQ